MQGFFFHSEIFLNSRVSPAFEIIPHPETGTPRAKLIVYYNNSEAFSPWQAGFGGIELANEATEEHIKAIIFKLDQFAPKFNCQTIRITQYPACYDGRVGLVNSLLLQSGYKAVFADVNFHLPLFETGSALNFRKGLSTAYRWKLNRLENEGFTFQINPNPDLEMVYSFLLESRQRKGFILAQTEDSFLQMFRNLPRVYTVFDVFAPDGHLAAQGVGLALSDSGYYLFYTADHLHYRKHSPVLLLHQGVYNFAQEQKYLFLDLGTASLSGKINTGVAQFKAGMGALRSEKITFLKNFSWFKPNFS